MSVPAKKAVPSLTDIKNGKKAVEEDKKAENTSPVTDEKKDETVNDDHNDNKAIQENQEKKQEDEKTDPKTLTEQNKSEPDPDAKVDNAGRVNGISPAVTALTANKTPSELAAETPDEAEQRYGKGPEPTEEDLDNPQIQVYRDDVVKQVPSGTHLHPDIVKDLTQRGIAGHRTDNAQVVRQINDGYDFAGNAEHNDKF